MAVFRFRGGGVPNSMVYHCPKFNGDCNHFKLFLWVGGKKRLNRNMTTKRMYAQWLSNKQPPPGPGCFYFLIRFFFPFPHAFLEKNKQTNKQKQKQKQRKKTKKENKSKEKKTIEKMPGQRDGKLLGWPTCSRC